MENESLRRFVYLETVKDLIVSSHHAKSRYSE